MTFERILSHFQVRKRGTGKAQCICPAHADREASLTLTDGNDRALIKSVIRKLAEKHPEDCQIIADNEDGSICAHVPVSWLRIFPPRQYTEEQRQQMGERLRQNRSENTATQG